MHKALILAATMGLCALAAQAAEPQDILKSLLAGAEADAALAGLKATADKDLLPVFEAACRSESPKLRGFAIAVMAELAGKDAAEPLLERVQKDSSVLLRRMALGQLLELEGLRTEQLADPLNNPDPRLRCLAARGLALVGEGDRAKPVLTELAARGETDVSGLAKLTLLAAGDESQLQPLRELLASEKTPDQFASLLMGLLAKDKVAHAAVLAEEMVGGWRAAFVKVDAAKALLAVSPGSAGKVIAIIQASDRPLLRAMLLETLAAANLPDADKHFGALAQDEGVIGSLAKLELARLDENLAGVEQAAKAALSHGHPFVASYVMGCARNDLSKAPRPAAEAYVAVLLEHVQSIKPDGPMGQDHMRVAQAAAMLAEMGTPAAMEGLAKILSGQPNSIQRAATAGLMRCEKPQQVAEMVRPLLKSPNEDIRMDAAIVLARAGDTQAAGALRELIAAGRQGSHLSAAAAWHVLQLEGKSKLTVEELAKAVK